jgi:hypothetical protein
VARQVTNSKCYSFNFSLQSARKVHTVLVNFISRFVFSLFHRCGFLIILKEAKFLQNLFSMSGFKNALNASGFDEQMFYNRGGARVT